MMSAVTDNKTNLTSGQIQEVMDRLLYKALEPVLMYTNLFDSQLSYMLALVTKNKKRKISPVGRDEVVSLLVRALACDDPEQKLVLIKKLRLERSFIHVFLHKFVERKETFFPLYQKFMEDPSSRPLMRERIQPFLDMSGCYSRQDYYLALNLTYTSLVAFRKYFNSVCGQYHKLCINKAKNLIETNPHNNYDFKDVVQNLLRRVVIAVNKYDASSGALTTYVKWWLYNSLTCNSGEHEYGLAYLVPQNVRSKMSKGSGLVNFSVSIDASVSEEDEDGECTLHNVLKGETQELDDEVANDLMLQHLYTMAKNADPYGIARLSLDIPEVFSKEELDFMRRTTLTKSVNKYA